MKFRGQGIGKGQNGFDKWLGIVQTSRLKENYGKKERLAKSFVEKYDEIRFDRMYKCTLYYSDTKVNAFFPGS